MKPDRIPPDAPTVRTTLEVRAPIDKPWTIVSIGMRDWAHGPTHQSVI